MGNINGSSPGLSFKETVILILTVVGLVVLVVLLAPKVVEWANVDNEPTPTQSVTPSGEDDE